MISTDEEYREGFNRAEKLREAGKISEAFAGYADLLEYYLEKLKQNPQMPFTINEFYIVDRLSDISLLIGNKKAAKHFLTALVLHAKTVGNIKLRIHVTTKLIFLNLHDGKLDEAFENAKLLDDITGDIKQMNITGQGLAAWEKNIQFDSMFSDQDEIDQFVCLYDALGALSLSIGQYAAGALLLQRGIQIGKVKSSPVVLSRLVPMKILLVKAYFQKGEIELAKSALRGISVNSKKAETASGIPISLLDLQSRMAFSTGEMGEAYRLLTEIKKLCNDNSLPLASILADFNLAQTKIMLNQVGEASEILEDCLVRAEQIGETDLALRIKRFLNLADKRLRSTLPSLNYVANKQQKISANETPVGAEPQQASSTYHRPADFLSFFEEKTLVFQMEMSENNIRAASAILTQLRLLASKCDSALIHMRLKVLECMFLFLQNKPLPANLSYGEILNFLEVNELLPDLWQFRNMLVHTELIPTQDRAGWIEKNQQLLDRITTSLPANMQTLYLLNKWSTNEEYIAGHTDQLLELKQKVQVDKFFITRWINRWKLSKSLHYFQENINRYKEFLTRSITTGIKPGEFIFQEPARGFLKKSFRQSSKKLTVSFLVLPDRIIVISRSFLKIRLHVTFISRIALRQLIFGLRDTLYPEGALREIGLEQIPSTASTDINEWLIHIRQILQIEAVIKEHKGQNAGITFIADDVLHGFPFTLLTQYDNSLPEKCQVSVSTSDNSTRSSRSAYTGKKAILIGVSEYAFPMIPLPGVLKEIEYIGKQLEKSNTHVNTLLNNQATRKETISHLQAAEIVHFACHGKFDFHKPDQSGLLLTQGESLTLKDISTLENLSGIRLIVLSSCRGAEHFILPGRWIIGLPEAFCRAGVQKVLAFLWPVADDFAAAFTSRFYDYLSNHSPAESLRLTILNAKRRELGNLTCEYWNPAYWAGAILYEG